MFLHFYVPHVLMDEILSPEKTTMWEVSSNNRERKFGSLYMNIFKYDIKKAHVHVMTLY